MNCEKKCECEKGRECRDNGGISNGLFIIVLFILLAIILGPVCFF